LAADAEHARSDPRDDGVPEARVELVDEFDARHRVERERQVVEDEVREDEAEQEARREASAAGGNGRAHDGRRDRRLDFDSGPPSERRSPTHAASAAAFSSLRHGGPTDSPMRASAARLAAGRRPSALAASPESSRSKNGAQSRPRASTASRTRDGKRRPSWA